MKSRIVKIGNSQGVRIPKPLIAEAGIEEEIEISVEDNRLVITPARETRAGWNDSFEKMSGRGDDKLLDKGMSPTVWDEEEWEWK